MFTGIIEAIGTVTGVWDLGSKRMYELTSTFTPELKTGDSVSHDGVCLTVAEIMGSVYRVHVIDTTLAVSNIDWQVGSKVNLERAMTANGRFDGHIVQGHVDATGEVLAIIKTEGSVMIHVQIPVASSAHIIDKGSICLNGISLTIVRALDASFQVAIIPFTWDATNLLTLKAGNMVNLEFDVIGKYVQRIMNVRV